MKHLFARLVLRPAIWIFDAWIAFRHADHDQFWETYRAQRAESRGVWCAYTLVREGRQSCGGV